MKTILNIALIICLAVPVIAQQEKDSYYDGLSIGLKTGFNSYLGNIPAGKVSRLSTLGGAFGFSIDKGFSNKMRIGANINYGFLKYLSDDYLSATFGFKNTLVGGDLYVKFLPFGEKNLTNEGNVLPYITLGIGFNSMSISVDSLSADGSIYYYWSDGTIRDMVESYENFFVAKRIDKDYVFETKVSGGGFVYVPIGIGADFKLGRKAHASLSLNYMVAFTNNLDNYIGGGGLDGYMNMAIGFTYRLSETNQKTFENLEDNIPKELFNQILVSDDDQDGILDFVDDCQKTPKDVDVDSKGCPLDSDKDGIPDYRDLEPNSTLEAVDEKGIGLTKLAERALQDMYSGRAFYGTPKAHYQFSKQLYNTTVPANYKFTQKRNAIHYKKK